MALSEDKHVGRFKVEFEVANNDDLALVRGGYLTADKVRRLKILGLVDSGATSLVLPTTTAKQLGIPVTGKVKVTYANRKTSRRDTVDGVYLDLLGRHGIFTATLEPKRDIALIGAIVLEQLDFLIDSRQERLYPRDPKIIMTEAESSSY